MRVPDDTQARPELPLPVSVTLEDGNAFAILGAVGKAMKDAGISPEVRDLFMAEATAGDYDRLLATVMEWVEVD